MKIAIIGAGIGGLTLLHYYRNKVILIKVFEKMSQLKKLALGLVSEIMCLKTR